MLRIFIELDRREMDKFTRDQRAGIVTDLRILGNRYTDPMDVETCVYWSPFDGGWQPYRMHILVTASIHRIEDLAEDSSRMARLKKLREGLYEYIRANSGIFKLGKYSVTIRPVIDEVDPGIFVGFYR